VKFLEGLLWALLALGAVACQSDCESANEKLEGECREEIRRAMEGRGYAALPLTGGSEECNEDEECIAECINDADCDSIASVMVTGGVQTDPNVFPPEEFMACLRECDPRL
jgi:hypothetical protein